MTGSLGGGGGGVIGAIIGGGIGGGGGGNGGAGNIGAVQSVGANVVSIVVLCRFLF